jgi:hypothetical protein
MQVLQSLNVLLFFPLLREYTNKIFRREGGEDWLRFMYISETRYLQF